jgi:outer membrane protein assembly factor BamE (lipoprotein component of BamABCDE complex)
MAAVRTILLFLCLTLAACISSRSESGVINKWRDQSLPEFEPGKTTQAEVAKALGPPSQLINLESGLVFYYLLEKARSTGVILIVYNNIKERVIYDRAIFFFDQQGVLTDYALSLEETEYTPPEKPEKPKDTREAPAESTG